MGVSQQVEGSVSRSVSRRAVSVMPVDVAGFVSVLIPKALAASVAAQSVDMQQHLGSPRQDSADCEDSPPEPGRTVTVQLCYDDAVAAIVAANVAAVEEAVVVTTTKKRPAPTTRVVARQPYSLSTHPAVKAPMQQEAASE